MTRSLTAILAVAIVIVGVSAQAQATPERSTAEEEIPQTYLSFDDDGVLNNPFHETLHAIEPVILEYEEAYALHELDWSELEIVIYLVPGESAEEFKRRAAAAAAAVPAGIELRYEEASVAAEEIDRLAKELFDSRQDWSPTPGLVHYTYADARTATVHVGVGEAAAFGDLGSSARTPSGAAVTVNYSIDGPPVPEAGNRLADQGSWTGGNWIHFNADVAPTTNNSACTMGFTWRMWSTGALVGGTAEHCINTRTGTCEATSTQRYWFHNRRHIGPLFRTSPGTDSALLQPAPSTSFSPTVWVGLAGTSTERAVKSAPVAVAVGDLVALSAARNGTPDTITTVLATRVNTCFGQKVVLTEYVSEGGDSGGPWLQTFSNGTVIAHGQHFGRVSVNGITRSAYTPQVLISAAMQASIAIAP